MNTPITIVRFSFRGEEDIIVKAILSDLLAWPHANIHIVDDANDPMREQFVNSIKKLGPNVHYHTSDFDRGHNLNGKDAIMGVLEWEYKCAMYDYNFDGLVFKMDPDTLVVSPRFINEAISQGARWISHNTPIKRFAGMFYAAAPRLIKMAYDNLSNMTLHNMSEEDLVIGSMLYIAAHKDKFWYADITIPANTPMFCAADVLKIGKEGWDSYLDALVNQCGIVTVGNTGVEKIAPSYRTLVMDQIWEKMVKLKQNQAIENQTKETSETKDTSDVLETSITNEVEEEVVND